MEDAEQELKLKTKRDLVCQNIELQRNNNWHCSTIPPGLRDAPGRPRLEENQPGLMETIAEIASFGGTAYDRRRTEKVRSCKTLDDL